MNTRFKLLFYGKFISDRIYWILAAGIIGSMGYLIASRITYGFGYPLDDAWIHQTYARNLSESLKWAFLPNMPSGGSTSPLWTVLVAIGYWSGFSPFSWTIFLGVACLIALSWFAELLFRQNHIKIGIALPIMGIFAAGEWHLVWSAASGMETILLALLIVLVFYLLSRENVNWFLAGAIIGLSVWVRPDAVTLLGPGFFITFLRNDSLRAKTYKALRIMAGFALFFLPYLLFNYQLAGSVWPNTFYAKQAEYAILRNLGIIQRYFSIFILPLIGPGILLLPGWLFFVVKGIKEKSAFRIAMILWWLGYTLIYALFLPVNYQHGRYLIPAMPVYFIAGLIGSFELSQQIGAANRPRLILQRTWFLSIAAVWIAFQIMGAITYADDVAIIETEMVSTARWIDSNTDPDAVIAAHDIGALGYFGQRDIIDLAGLISPEVIPFIRDESQLAAFLNEKQAEYLVTFPGWYPKLVSQGTLIHQSSSKFSPDAGGENMEVLRWRNSSN
jgi:hypothetical protein